MIIKSERRNTFIFLIVLFAYLLYMSLSTHLWNDEHVFYRFAWTFQQIKSNHFLDILNYSKQAFHPPLYLIFVLISTKIANLFIDPSFVFYRFPSVVATCLSVYLILKELKFKNKSILSLIFILSFQVQVFYYAFDFGPYAITFLFSTLYIIKLSQTWNKETLDKKDLFYLTFYIVGLSYLHYFGTILIFCCGIVYISRSYLLKKNFRFYLASHVLGFLFFLPWLIYSFERLSQNSLANTQMIQQENVNILFDFITFMTSFSANSLLLLMFIFCIILSALKNRPNLVLSFALFLFLINLRSVTVFPLFIARYSIPLLPILFILFCVGLDHLASTKKVYFLYVFFLLSQGPRLDDFNRSIDARWLNPPYQLQLISNIKRQDTKYTFYFFFNSVTDLYPYESVFDRTQFNLHPVGVVCDPTKFIAPAIFLTTELFCPSQLLLSNGFSLLNEEYGSTIWIKDE